ncbi:unnamed protein product [Taenia asiatica]|uniref:J domain-containing protein n=1 Tax=Taenia asiatica TaxID=60517 RepID=A0A0R3W9U5_TAEAS|nr:unnamed protein product [Taenia asiatica]
MQRDKGYKRILSIGTQGVTTYRKDNLRVTNQWLYQEIFAIRPDSGGAKSGNVNNQQKFNLIAGGAGGRKDMSFSSEYRTDILTDMLRFRSLFAEESRPNVKLSAVKITWSEKEKPVFLEITPISIDQIDQVTGTRVACYAYRDIRYLSQHLFRCSDPVSLMNAAVEAAALYLGLILNRSPSPLTVDWCREMRLGPTATPENMISTAEFVLQKVAPYRHGDSAPPTSRTLCLTDCLLVERDPTSYRPISAQSLREVFALIRSRREPQMLSIEYMNGKVHTYYSSERDSLLCSILDGVRASGNQCVCVRSTKSRRSLRIQPTSVPSSEEVESMHLRFLRQPPEDVSFWEVVERFNANVAYSGLVHAVSQDGIFTENKERLIKDALIVLLSRCPGTNHSVPTDGDFIYRKGLSDREVRLQLEEARFQAIRRLVASKAGFEAFTQLSGVRENLGRAVVAALAQNDDALTHAVVDAVNTLMQPMHESPDLRQEQLNKASIMSSAPFMRQLVNLFTLHAIGRRLLCFIDALINRPEPVQEPSLTKALGRIDSEQLRGTGSLVIAGLLDFFTFALCLPYSETSDGASFETLLAMVASRGRAIFRLFSGEEADYQKKKSTIVSFALVFCTKHPSLAIVKGAGLVMRALIDEASEELVAQLRQMSLAEGALLQHISIACFANINDPRNLVLRQLSRQLIALWTENNPQAQDLLKRIFVSYRTLYEGWFYPAGVHNIFFCPFLQPEGLLSFLESPDPPPEMEKDHLFVRDNLQLAQEHVLRVQNKKSEPLYILQERVDSILQHWRVKVGLQPRAVRVTCPIHQVSHPLASYSASPNQSWDLPDSAPTLGNSPLDRGSTMDYLVVEMPWFSRVDQLFTVYLISTPSLDSLLKPSTPNIEDRPVALRLTRRMRIKLGTPDTRVDGKPIELSRTLNWPLFYYHFQRDHAKPDLIWNLRTRDELKDAIEKEIGEYSRECNFFSHSRREDEDDGGVSVADYSEMEPVEEAEAAEALEARENGDGDDDATVASDSNLDGPSKKSTSSATPVSPFERQVSRLLAQVNEVSWNHAEFRVRYHSLAAEPRVGNYFLRLLLEEDKRLASVSADAAVDASTLGLSRIKNSREFFSELFRRYLQYTAALGSMNSSLGSSGRIPRGKRGRGRRGNHLLSMRCLCLNAMSIVYGRCYSEIGAVSDIPLLVHLMDRTPSAAERDCLITLLEKLVINKYNADEFLEADGVRVVTDLACLSHLHTSRAPVPTATNVLKGDADNPEAAEGGGATQREWWYWRTTEPRASEGPFTFAEIRQKLSDGSLVSNTYVFAQGLDSQPRCRIEGVFVDTEEDENEAFGSNSTSDFAPFGATTTGAAGTTKTPSASTLGWMPANRVTQLRWSVPRLLFGEDAERGDVDESETERGGEGADLITKLGVSQGAILDHTALAIRCVEVLKRLCESSASRDEATGGIIRPLPKPRRTISSPFNLPHIVQLLLTFDPPLVERVTSLLLHVVDQNPCLPRIYLTGVFFFILMYTGSNTSETGLPSVLSKILPEAMIAFLENHPPEKFAEIFLGNFDTPEAIWNQEMRRFMISRIAAHLADFTPRLKSNVRSIYHYIGIPRIVYAQLECELFCNRYYLRHFCDIARFPDWPVKDPIALLRDILAFWRVETEKKPSRITYEDSLRELGLEASQLNESNQEASIRRAYYQLSMKYHPDKNPNGQAKFQAVKAAYNFLCERGLHSDGPNRRHIQLLIRAQSILYSRYRKELTPHKYAGYPALIRTIRMEVEDETLFQKGLDTAAGGSNTTELLSSSTELAYETVATSALNAEELRREGGLKTLQDAFERCSALLSLDDKLNNQLATNVCCHVTGFFTVSTKFPPSRECIYEMPQIVREILRLLYYKNLSSLCCQAAACVAAFCDEFWLCRSVYHSGGVFMLLYHVLAYDFTLEESGVEASSATNKQVDARIFGTSDVMSGYFSTKSITLNQLSLLCLWALARLLNGIVSNESQCKESPSSTSVEFTLSRLLTPHITRKLLDLAQTTKPPAPVANIDILLMSPFLLSTSESGRTLRQLAKLLTTNSATPCFIWDNQCRAQMSGFLDEQVSHLVKTGEADLDAVKTFEHKTFQGELLVGEIFVRIFNKQPTFPLDQNPKGFVIDLLNYLKTELPLLPKTSDGLPTTTKRVTHLESALEALRNVVRSYAGVELQCIGHFDILFGILELEGYTDLKLRSIEALHAVAKNPECLNDIHASNLLVVAVILFRALPLAHLPLLDFFTHVVAVNSLLKELVYAGGLIYLLEAITTSEVPEVRRGSAELLSRCLANPQLGRRIQALLGQFLPFIFPETIRGSPEQFISLYDSDHFNPELIWNQDCRDHLTEAIIDMCNRFNRQQEKNHGLKWSLPDAYAVSYATAITAALHAHNLIDTNGDSVEAEASLSNSLEVVCVGGVYLQLYVSQAAGRWMLRQPEVFLEALMNRILETFNRKSPGTYPGLLRLLSRAALQLLADRPGLLDGLPKKGFAHRILDLCPTVNEPEEARTCALLIHAMSASKLCVGAMMERETIAGYLHVISYCVGEELGTVGETFFNVFSTTGCDPLVAQALNCDLIDFLLQTLQRGLPVTVREPGQCRAYIVKALKAMQKSPLYGTQVSAKLDAESNRWSEFRDQSHALFLTNAPQSVALASAYLTAGAGGSSMHAGFLTGCVSSGATGTGAAASAGVTGVAVAPSATATSIVLGPGGVPIAPPQPRP